MVERFANNAIGTLSAGISDSATSLSLQSGEGAEFPASGNFRIVIGSEIIIVGGRSTDSLTSLTRGAESTTAVAHSSGDTVTQVATAGALDAFVQDTGDETIAGIKTFSSIPVGPASDPTTANQLARKTYVDTKVSLTGAETVAGVKTFSSIPLGPSSNPTTDDHLARKAYVDAQIAALSLPVVKRKTSDQSWTSNTVLANITDLTFSADASSTYEVDWTLILTGVSTADHEFALSLPTGATAFWAAPSGSSGQSNWQFPASTINPVDLLTQASLPVAGGNSGTYGIILHAIIIIAGTAGTVALQHAQDVSSGTAATVKANSLLRYQKAT